MIASAKMLVTAYWGCRLVTYQEEGVGKEGVQEYGPANPSASALASVDDFRNCNGRNDAHKLVAGVGDQIEELRLAGDAQEVASKLQSDDFNNDHDQSLCCSITEQLRLEIAS